MNNLNIVLEKVIMNNNEKLINNTVELMKTLATSQGNSITQTFNINPNNEIAYVKTPKWLAKKKLYHQSNKL